MSWLTRLTRGGRAQETDPQPPTDLEFRIDDVHMEMACALTFGLQKRNERDRFVEHCARVTRLVESMAPVFRLDADRLATLRAAAQLHELGMLALPDGLLDRAGPLDAAELAQVRAQADIGARIVAITYDPRTARLIRHQYADFRELHRQGLSEAELLLTSILRVADVFDTLSYPRPYQAAAAQALRSHVLLHGVGTRFHPDAVTVLLQVHRELPEYQTLPLLN